MGDDNRGPIERLAATPEFSVFMRHLVSLLESERERHRLAAEKESSEGHVEASAAASTQAWAVAALTPKLANLPRDLIAKERGQPSIQLGSEPGYRGV